jgi:integrase
MKESQTPQRWTKTGINNLVRHRSGGYYARLFIGGKERWRSLKTTVLEVAKNRLRDAQKEEKPEQAPKAKRGQRMTMADAIKRLEGEIDEGTPLRRRHKQHNEESSREYRRETLAALQRSWEQIIGAALPATEARKVTKDHVRKWAREYRAEVSSSRFNNTLGTLRRLFEIAIADGEAYSNPAAGIERAEVKAKKLTLPERETFPQFVAAIRNGEHRTNADAADMVEFLAYTGSRVDEARHVLWSDVSFPRGTVHLRKTKNGKERTVPMIAEARALLEKMRAGRCDEDDTKTVLRVREARGAMTRAAKAVGMTRITHHDLRHLFATVAIESGVDIPTVSRWLGHLDGGSLALRTYGHLRDDHSKAAAAKVSFAPITEGSVG